MIYSNDFLKYMTELEGNVPYVYDDKTGKAPINGVFKGYPTIGIGCRVYDKSLYKYTPKNPMSASLVNTLFRNRAKEFITAVETAIKVPLAPYQFDALITLAFNIGSTGFKNSTLVQKINSGFTGDSLKPYFDAWNKVTNLKTGTKEVNATLVNRRKMEFHLFDTGEYLGYDLKPLSFSKKKILHQ
jgi:lysozyme